MTSAKEAFVLASAIMLTPTPISTWCCSCIHGQYTADQPALQSSSITLVRRQRLSVRCANDQTARRRRAMTAC